MSQPLADAAGVYALLADGTTVQIRPANPGDFEAVKALLGDIASCIALTAAKSPGLAGLI